MDFGIIIHYGLYSYYGFDDIKSAKKRNVQNGSEWYYGRLIDNNNFRPISGNKLTKKYHELNYNNIDYFENLDKLITDKKKIKKWITIAKTNGAKYIILTSKHHDGVCLWNTTTTKRKTEMDICKIFSDECKKEDMQFGFYYSWFEFDKPFTLKYFNEFCITQLSELLEYEPNYIWFDGDWKIKQKTIEKQIKNIVEIMKNKNIIINDRIGKNNVDLSDYRVFSDRFIPENKLTEIKWQHINTIGYSWGFNKEQTTEDYKKKEYIYELYKKINNLGGMFLINFGPDKNGDIVKEELEAIEMLK